MDYVSIDCPGNYTLNFTGSIENKIWPIDPHSGLYAFWSNRSDDSNMTLTRKFDLTSVDTSVELNYWVWYDLEPMYDYLYLEASTDGGQTWDVIKTPSGSATGKFGTGYNGKSGVWINEKVNVSRYNGTTVLFRFEYMTDRAWNDTGFLLDDSSIDAIGYGPILRRTTVAGMQMALSVLQIFFHNSIGST
ncbi:MAG TPA: hypothetical protein VFR47_07610 [Anaerolineales bacterium]|nr:hypothetical protein [Anaerolineales bacterium]